MEIKSYNCDFRLQQPKDKRLTF